MALRKAARTAGAEIYEQTEVTAAVQTASGEWKLTTSKGEITAEHVVLCTGNYARQTGRMFGLKVPAIPVEHQYIVYDESPELKAYRNAGGRELAVLREPDQSYYFREERMGWILGPYEAGAPARFADGLLYQSVASAGLAGREGIDREEGEVSQHHGRGVSDGAVGHAAFGVQCEAGCAGGAETGQGGAHAGGVERV